MAGAFGGWLPGLRAGPLRVRLYTQTRAWNTPSIGVVSPACALRLRNRSSLVIITWCSLWFAGKGSARQEHEDRRHLHYDFGLNCTVLDSSAFVIGVLRGIITTDKPWASE